MIKIGNKCDFLTYIIYVTDMYWAILFWYLKCSRDSFPLQPFQCIGREKAK